VQRESVYVHMEHRYIHTYILYVLKGYKQLSRYCSFQTSVLEIKPTDRLHVECGLYLKGEYRYYQAIESVPAASCDDRCGLAGNKVCAQQRPTLLPTVPAASCDDRYGLAGDKACVQQ
jgi:hypothetical protein